MRYGSAMISRLLALAISLAGATGCGFGFSDGVPIAEVTLGRFESVLSAHGELKATNSASISSPAARGSLKITFLAEEGSRVKQGDTLIEFDASELEKNLADANDQLEISRTKIDQKRAQLDLRLADLANNVTRAELNLERSRLRLSDSETIPRVEREGARLDVQEHTLSVERAKASLESARLEGEAELQLIQLEVKQRQSYVDSIERDIGKMTVTAANGGLVILPEIWKGGSRGRVKVGDTIWANRTVMQIPDLSQMEVVSWVQEIDAARVQRGQTVAITLDAHPDRVHRGTIRHVADLAVKRDSDDIVKQVRIAVDLAKTTPEMKPGMTVRGDIEVFALTEVLSIPREAVFRDGAERFVYTLGLTGWSRTPITVAP